MQHLANHPVRRPPRQSEPLRELRDRQQPTAVRTCTAGVRDNVAVTCFVPDDLIVGWLADHVSAPFCGLLSTMRDRTTATASGTVMSLSSPSHAFRSSGAMRLTASSVIFFSAGLSSL